MKFDSLDAFLNMGGYGFYVWLSYGLTFLLLSTLVITSLQSHKNTQIQIRKKLKRKIKLREAATQLSD